MSDWITELATTGATTLVAAAATDAWPGARSSFARLFGRSGRPPLADKSTLDETAAQLMQSAGQGRDVQIGQGTARLAQLLAAEPHLAEELRTLLNETRSQMDGSVRTQIAVASGGGTVYMSGGSQTIYNYRESRQQP